MTKDNDTTSAIPGFDMATLLGEQKKTPLETALEKVSPDDASAVTVSEAKFQFRDLLDDKQRIDLRQNAPMVATKMVQDYNVILDFGSPVLKKLNDSSVQLLKAQEGIKIPGAEEIVNNLLREIDGFQSKYQNAKVDNVVSKIRSFFKSNVYSLQTMVRETKPITDKIDMAELSLKDMERQLRENVSRGQLLHKQTLETVEQVVSVLAALEEITEVVRNDFNTADVLLKSVETSGQEVASVEWRGELISANQLNEIHTDLANGVSELEKTWFAWRQQFFLGYAQAPAVRNLAIVSMSMQRRIQQFRTMALPSARSALAMWQQSVLAEEAATMSDAVTEATNKLIQTAFSETARTVEKVANAAETPSLSAESILVVTESIKSQCNSIVNAANNGRDARAKILVVMNDSEKAINETVVESRREFVKNALQNASSTDGIITQDSSSPDILKSLGVE